MRRLDALARAGEKLPVREPPVLLLGVEPAEEAASVRAHEGVRDPASRREGKTERRQILPERPRAAKPVGGLNVLVPDAHFAILLIKDDPAVVADVPEEQRALFFVVNGDGPAPVVQPGQQSEAALGQRRPALREVLIQCDVAQDVARVETRHAVAYFPDVPVMEHRALRGQDVLLRRHVLVRNKTADLENPVSPPAGQGISGIARPEDGAFLVGEAVRDRAAEGQQPLLAGLEIADKAVGLPKGHDRFSVTAQDASEQRNLLPEILQLPEGGAVQAEPERPVLDIAPAHGLSALRRLGEAFQLLAGGVGGGRAGDGLHALAHGDAAVGRQAVPVHVDEPVPGHEVCLFAVPPEETGAGPGLPVAGRGAFFLALAEKTGHGAAVVAQVEPHAVEGGRGRDAHHAELPAPDEGLTLDDAGNGAAARRNGLNAAGLFVEKRRHVHDEASRGRRGGPGSPGPGPGGLGGLGGGGGRHAPERAEDGIQGTHGISLLVFSCGADRPDDDMPHGPPRSTGAPALVEFAGMRHYLSSPKQVMGLESIP